MTEQRNPEKTRRVFDRVDVFGRLQLEVIQNPEEELVPESVELCQVLQGSVDPHPDLVEGAKVAQAAFTRNPPTDQDVYDHMLADTLVLAYEGDEMAGFSGTDYLEDENLVLGSGLAIHPDYQERGIGSLIRTRGIMEDVLNGNSRPENPFLRDEARTEDMNCQGYFAARSANPAILSHMQDQYGAFPREGQETPQDVERAMEMAAEQLDPDSEFNAPVMMGAYPGQMNDMPDHELSGYLEDLMEEKGSGYESGDALIMTARLNDLEETYDLLLDNVPYRVEESVI